MSPYVQALRYPFHRENLGLMLVGVVVFCLPPILEWIFPLAGVLVLIIQLFLVFYFAIFFQGILEASMAGKADFPAWPEDVHGFSIVENVFSLLGPYVVSFLPLIILRCAYANFGELGRQAFGIGLTFLLLSGPLPYEVPNPSHWFAPMSWALATLGLLYLPMALLVWSFYGGNSILNPSAVIRSAARTGRSYLLLVLWIAALLFGWWGGTKLMAVVSIEWIRSTLSTLILFYVLCVIMRMIGLHYYVNRDRLQWCP